MKPDDRVKLDELGVQSWLEVINEGG